MSNCNPAGPSESIVGCNSGDTGCRSWPSVISNPEATVSGNISCSNPGASGWCLGSASLEISANEPLAGYNILAVEGTRNGATFACSGSSCSVPLSEGNNDFSFWALSSWGDSSSMGSASEGIDTQPPLVSGQLAGVTGGGGWFVSSVSATVAASDATSGIGSIVYSLDGGPQTAYLGAVTLGDGSHSIVFYAMDRAGNSSSVSLSANIDTVLPSVAIDSPSGTLGDNGWYVSGAALGASADDAGSGLASLEYSLDGGSSAAYTGPVALPDGVDTIVFTATDHAGNSASRSATVNVDTTAPQLTLNAFNAFCPACNQRLAIDYVAADNGSGVAEWTLLADGITLANGVAAESGTFEWDGSSLGPGAHTITLQGRDLAGNTTQVQMIVTLATPTPTPKGLNIPMLKLPLIIHPANPPAADTATPNAQSGGGGQPASTQTAAAPTATRTNSIIVAMGNPAQGSNAGQSISNPATTSPLIPNAALFGAEAAAAISAAMAVVVAQQRKRQEEEAQAAAASAAFNATQIALEEERRREAAQRAWDKKQQDEAKAAEEAASAAFESKLSEAMGWGLRPQDAGYYSSLAQTDGYAAAIAALSAYIEQAKEALAAWEKALKEAEERKRKEAEEKARKEAEEKARQEAEAAAAAQQAAAAASAEAEKNKPWWQKAVDAFSYTAGAVIQFSLDMTGVGLIKVPIIGQTVDQLLNNFDNELYQSGREAGRKRSNIVAGAEVLAGGLLLLTSIVGFIASAGGAGACTLGTGGGCGVVAIPILGVVVSAQVAQASAGAVLAGHGIFVMAADAANPIGSNSSGYKYPTSELPQSGDRYYEPPKQKGNPEVVKTSDGGFRDKWDNIWYWSKDQHGGPHWDVEHLDGTHTNVSPDGIVIGKDNFPNK